MRVRKVELVFLVFSPRGCEMPGAVCVTLDVSGCVIKFWPLSVPAGAELPSSLFGPACAGWSDGGWGARVFACDTPGTYVQYVVRCLSALVMPRGSVPLPL